MHLFELAKVEPRYVPKKRNVSKPDVSLFKGQQKPVFDGLMQYIQDDSGITGSALLDAPAGCGKTYVVSKIIENILSISQDSKKDYHIAVTATTNKAVKVTYRQADYYHSAIDYKTVHSLLGLKEMITMDGKQIFVQDPKKVPELDCYDLVIIDESSMLDDLLFTGGPKLKGLQEYIEEGLKVIFVGDSCQIPPINRDRAMIFDPEAREMYNIKYFTMDEIVRQAADNPIIALATEVRRKLHIPKSYMNETEHRLWDDDKGVYFIDRQDDDGMEDMQAILEHIFLSENFKADPDFGKILAYHRVVVSGMNNIIRNLLYGEEAEENRLIIGDKLVVNAPIFDDDKKVMLPNNEEIDVMELVERVELINDGAYRIPYYDAKVQYYRFDNSILTKRIKVPTLEGQEIVDEILEKLSTMAKAFGKSLSAGRAWKDYFEFKETFADVGYNYALTTHKAQGSTYENAIVLEYDIDRNRKIKERQRIKYTAFTRPAKRLFIIN